MCVIPAGIESLLAVLDARYRLGVLTNGVREWQLAKLDGHGLADTFDAVVASYEAGAHKPDRAAYDLARERLPADAYVMIGDDLETDVIGAREAGFGAIHLDRHADAPAALDDPATLREAFEQAN
jgi:putative hydrolase of the HAD superfamily